MVSQKKQDFGKNTTYGSHVLDKLDDALGDATGDGAAHPPAVTKRVTVVVEDTGHDDRGDDLLARLLVAALGLDLHRQRLGNAGQEDVDDAQAVQRRRGSVQTLQDSVVGRRQRLDAHQRSQQRRWHLR